METPIYDQPWTAAEQDRYFTNLERQLVQPSKRGWGIFLALFIGFFVCLWAESWNSVEWLTALIVVGYLILCGIVFLAVLASHKDPRN